MLSGGPSATVDLRRAGKSFVAVGKIPVPSTQPAGPVTVTVTITYDGKDTVLTCTSQINASGAQSSPSPSGSPSASPSASPAHA